MEPIMSLKTFYSNFQKNIDNEVCIEFFTKQKDFILSMTTDILQALRKVLQKTV
jgi:hypothetical protein